MTLFVWNNIYSVGVDQIDTQHRALIDRMNILYECYTENASRMRTLAALDELISYTVKHFKWEEDAMRKAGYVELDSHIKHHQKLISQVGCIQQKIKDGSRQLDDSLMNFLKNWLQGHILGIDKKYTATLQAYQQAQA